LIFVEERRGEHSHEDEVLYIRLTTEGRDPSEMPTFCGGMQVILTPSINPCLVLFFILVAMNE
jgi:hypothetical protein